MVAVVSHVKDFLEEQAWDAEALSTVVLILEIDEAVAEEKTRSQWTGLRLAFCFVRRRIVGLAKSRCPAFVTLAELLKTGLPRWVLVVGQA